MLCPGNAELVGRMHGSRAEGGLGVLVNELGDGQRVRHSELSGPRTVLTRPYSSHRVGAQPTAAAAVVEGGVVRPPPTAGVRLVGPLDKYRALRDQDPALFAPQSVTDQMMMGVGIGGGGVVPVGAPGGFGGAPAGRQLIHIPGGNPPAMNGVMNPPAMNPPPVMNPPAHQPMLPAPHPGGALPPHPPGFVPSPGGAPPGPPAPHQHVARPPPPPGATAAIILDQNRFPNLYLAIYDAALLEAVHDAHLMVDRHNQLSALNAHGDHDSRLLSDVQSVLVQDPVLTEAAARYFRAGGVLMVFPSGAVLDTTTQLLDTVSADGVQRALKNHVESAVRKKDLQKQAVGAPGGHGQHPPPNSPASATPASRARRMLAYLASPRPDDLSERERLGLLNADAMLHSAEQAADGNTNAALSIVQQTSQAFLNQGAGTNAFRKLRLIGQNAQQLATRAAQTLQQVGFVLVRGGL